MTLEYQSPTDEELAKWLKDEPPYFRFLPEDIVAFYREVNIGPFSEPRWRNEAGVADTVMIDLLSRILAKP